MYTNDIKFSINIDETLSEINLNEYCMSTIVNIKIEIVQLFFIVNILF